MTRAKTKYERLHSVKNNSNFEIAAFFPSPYRWWKSAAISKLELFLTEWSRSYIFLALVLLVNLKLDPFVVDCDLYRSTNPKRFQSSTYDISLLITDLEICKLLNCLTRFRNAKQYLHKYSSNISLPSHSSQKCLILSHICGK